MYPLEIGKNNFCKTGINRDINDPDPRYQKVGLSVTEL
jgi:hypothetical protein